MPQCVLGLGTNLYDCENNLKNAIDAISLLPKTSIGKTSKIYVTPAWGVTDQPDFLNCCVLINTELSPNTLLGCCLGIEAAMGRKRLRHWGERIIDIDLICYEEVEMQTQELWLPHKYMLERAFVLLPLLDIFPNGNCLGVDFSLSLSNIDKSGIALFESE